jgi:hypothetical protein
MEEAEMDGTHFDAWTRRASTVTRKASLTLLGTSVIALAAARPPVGKAKKTKKKSCSTTCGQKCAAQVAPCKTYWTGFCDDNVQCREDHHECCDSLATCNGRAYFVCIDLID